MQGNIQGAKKGWDSFSELIVCVKMMKKIDAHFVLCCQLRLKSSSTFQEFHTNSVVFGLILMGETSPTHR